MIEENAYKSYREIETKLIDVCPHLELKEEQSHDDTIVSELDQEHCNEDPCLDSIDRILHPILNYNMLVQCVDTDLVSNLEITPRINLKLFPLIKLRDQLFQVWDKVFNPPSLPNFLSLLLWVCSNQMVTSKNFSQEFEHCRIIGEKALSVCS